jgi:hypothetical protein
MDVDEYINNWEQIRVSIYKRNQNLQLEIASEALLYTLR